ncbi:MAG: sugar phosphate isomerase/epimerase [Bacteroidetes bacterium]|nr:MAG: sugar phosphate isomerase/epimerase [Bacteroidota bacterium]
MQNRRTFMKSAALAAAAISAGKVVSAQDTGNNPIIQEHPERELFFDISLAQWSLNKALFGKELDNLDFPAYAQKNFDIHAVEYVNQFFKEADTEYIKELLKRTQDIGVKNVLIMIDGEGNLGDTDEEKRKEAIEKHYKWVEYAHILGCHSIRVNAGGRGSAEEVAFSATRSLRTLSQFAADYGINIIVENHGGYSSRASWLTSVIRNTGMVNCGVLPDFGNFVIDRRPGGEKYDLYLGMQELMPLAKGVSAKSHNFDEEGNEVDKDFYRLMKIVKDSGFRGYVGIEYEGRELSQDEGIMATKNLLIKAGLSLM